jgi:Ca2+-binding RTX toxin-like protein
MPVINGSAVSEKLVGGVSPDEIGGFDGNDTLAGRGGNDTLAGGAGNDWLLGGDDDLYAGSAGITNTGDDWLIGGDGDDYMLSGDGADTLDGGGGRDTLYGGTGADALMGGAGADNISSDWGDILLDGGDGDDRITVSRSASESASLERILAGAGNDSISVDTPPDGLVVDGGEGVNSLQIEGAATATPINVYLDQLSGSGVSALGIRSLRMGSDYSSTSASAHVFGSNGADTIRTQGDADIVYAGGGADYIQDSSSYAFTQSPSQQQLYGGDGADTILASGYASMFLRGEEGNDSISGGGGFDDMHGNMGADTLAGGSGNDWVVGGKDNDRLNGDDGADIVYGNMGDDICDGNYGDDLVRGGQGADIVLGYHGDDWLSGDRGADTITGGLGRDVFHASQDVDLDLVKDFNQSEGDRVQLDPGTVYTVYQSGADTVIDFGGGHSMRLEGVTFATLKSGWMFGAGPPPPTPGADKLASPAVSFDEARMAGFTYDQTRDLIYVVTTDGLLKVCDVTRGTYVTLATVGGKPSTIATTPDGRYALIGDSQTTAAATGPYMRIGSVTRVDLTTMATERMTFQFEGHGSSGGVTDIVVSSDGQAYMSTYGSPGLLTFDADAPVLSVSNPLVNASAGEADPLVMSEGGRFLAMIREGISPGGIYVIDTLTDKSVPMPRPQTTLISSGGLGDISEAAGKAVIVGSGITVWALDGTGLIRDLNAFSARGGVIGAKFSANGEHLYLWDDQQGHVIAIDTTSWEAVGAVQVRANVELDYFSSHQGEMDLTADGRYLILDLGKGLEIIDLAKDLSLLRTGGAAAERIAGDVGSDTLDGAAGNDTLLGYGGVDRLIGGSGDDILTGGTGADIFVGSAGLDRVTDFNTAEGDRVNVDAGAVYSVAQFGADTVITIDGGGQMVLEGVTLASLPANWLYLG